MTRHPRDILLDDRMLGLQGLSRRILARLHQLQAQGQAADEAERQVAAEFNRPRSRRRAR